MSSASEAPVEAASTAPVWSRSDRGAVRTFRLVRFLGPPAEPDVRVVPASGSPQAHVIGLRLIPLPTA